MRDKLATLPALTVLQLIISRRPMKNAKDYDFHPMRALGIAAGDTSAR